MLIVQLLPGFTTRPDTQVPPVIENVPVPVALVIVGAAVRVSGPEAAAALLTVRVPFFVVRSAAPVVRAGVGPANETVAPVTVNVTGIAVVPAAVPIGVVTVTFLVVSPAPRAIAQDAFTVVAVVTIPVHVMLPPMFTAVAPARPVPLRVTGTMVPRTPLVGVIEVSVGPTTVNVTGVGDVVAPAAVVTPMVWGPSGAATPIVSVAFTLVSLTTVILVTVTPVVPPKPVIAVAPVRPTPVKVTPTVCPRRPEV